MYIPSYAPDLGPLSYKHKQLILAFKLLKGKEVIVIRSYKREEYTGVLIGARIHLGLRYLIIRDEINIKPFEIAVKDIAKIKLK